MSIVPANSGAHKTSYRYTQKHFEYFFIKWSPIIIEKLGILKLMLIESKTGQSSWNKIRSVQTKL